MTFSNCAIENSVARKLDQELVCTPLKIVRHLLTPAILYLRSCYRKLSINAPPRSGQIKDYNIGMCCFSTTHATRRKSKAWLARNQDDVSNMSTCELLFQWVSTIKIQLSAC